MGKEIILPDWSKEIVVCIASGPSLTQEDVDYVKGKAKVITVNTSFRLAPWADIHYSSDSEWWQEYISEMETVCSGQFWTGHKTISRQYPQIKCIPWDRHAVGLHPDPNKITWGGNSGYCALGLAHKTGSKKIILLGYDMQGQDMHWHEDHPEKLYRPHNFEMWIKHFNHASQDAERLGIQIINCSRETALTCFSRQSLHDALLGIGDGTC